MYPDDLFATLFWANLGWYANYIGAMEQYIAEEELNARNRLREHWKLAGIDLEDGMYDPDHQQRYLEEYPRNLRYSFAVLFCSFIENSLRSTCNEISRRKGFKIEFADLNGSAIEKAKTFFKKVAVLQVDDSLWQPLHFVIEVRNKIVHTNGSVGNSKELRNRDGKVPGYTLRGDDIWLEKEFAQHVIFSVRELFRQIQAVSSFGYVDPQLIEALLAPHSAKLFADSDNV